MSNAQIYAKAARGPQRRPYGCQECGHLACVCNVKERHHDLCLFRRAMTCAVPIECDHGYDVCPYCDPCDCAVGVSKEDFADKYDL